jgi:hypothetical protein
MVGRIMTSETAKRRTTVRRNSPSDNIVWSSSTPWWERYDVANAEYLSWEGDACRVHEWAALRIPDVLHTAAYTRALLLADRVFRATYMAGGSLDSAGTRRLQDEVDSRQRRQDRLFGRGSDRPLQYTAVVEESTLRKVVGDAQVMRDQMTNLLDFAGCTSVTLRVIPEKACAQPGTDGGFAVLEFPESLLQTPIMFAHYPGGVLSESEPRVIDQAWQRLHAIQAVALPAPDSAEFIGQLIAELYPA